MLAVYGQLARLAQAEFGDIVTEVQLLGGTSSSPNKLRLQIKDGSFLDVWLSLDGDYAYHWECRRQRGQTFRWDNAPHHPRLPTFPDHFHEGDDHTVIESSLSRDPETALGEICAYIRHILQV
jgi:hypothetical protein